MRTWAGNCGCEGPSFQLRRQLRYLLRQEIPLHSYPVDFHPYGLRSGSTPSILGAVAGALESGAWQAQLSSRSTQSAQIRLHPVGCIPNAWVTPATRFDAWPRKPGSKLTNWLGTIRA